MQKTDINKLTTTAFYKYTVRSPVLLRTLAVTGIMFRNLICLYTLWQFQYSVYGDILKGSLTFVIDDTGSMGDDISQVKDKTKLIFDAVLKSNASNVDDFILTTFNDPGNITTFN